VFTIARTAIIVLLLAAAVLSIQPSVIAQTIYNRSIIQHPDSPSLNTVFNQVDNSVVQITRKIPTAYNNNNILNSPITGGNITLGSGFVYDNLGHIITTSNVISNAKIVDITLIGGDRYSAKVIGNDIFSDIAVLQIIDNNNIITQQHFLKPLIIGNSSKLEVGDKVIAIGNPYGFNNAMMTGIISQVGRLLPNPILGGEGAFSINNNKIIQTDIPDIPGNSGGPLLNMQGQVIGINLATDLVGQIVPDQVVLPPLARPDIIIKTSTTTNTDDIPPVINYHNMAYIDAFSGSGFAVPSSTIMRIVPTLIQKGNYVHPYLGLNGTTLTSDLAETTTADGLPINFKGILVDTIVKGGPADKAGIHGATTDQYSKKHGGDIITAIDKHPIITMDDLLSYIDEHKSAGNNVTLTIYRNGQNMDLKATLGAWGLPSFIP
jgi:S1-C subfamily serine protease